MFQVSPITVADVTVEFIVKPTGALGTCKMIAPLPEEDCTDVPNTFVEVIITIILSPYYRLNGEACKTVSGIVHYYEDTITELEPLQYVSS